MTTSAGPALHRLHDEFGDRVRFLTLYVREAHPGGDYPQPETLERKLAHARDYRDRDGIAWPVLVDDVDGSLHRQLDPKPHAAYLIGPDGTVWWRSTWANDEPLLRQALEAAAQGRPPTKAQRQPRVRPMLNGAGHMWETWQAAGGHAKRDVLREVPPMYLTGRIGAFLQPLPDPVRGGVAVALSMTAPLAAVLVARALVRRLRG